MHISKLSVNFQQVNNPGNQHSGQELEYYYISYLKVTRRRNLKNSHHREKNLVTMVMDGNWEKNKLNIISTLEAHLLTPPNH